METQYWIIKDGASNGPFRLEELKDKGITAETKVWCNQLAEWTPAGNVEALAPLLQTGSSTEQTAPPRFCADRFEKEPFSSTRSRAIHDPQQIYQQGYQKGLADGKLLEKDEDTGKCPPTNLAWAILATVLCTLPLGIVAIVYASKVASYYSNNDFTRAKKASNRALYWSLASFIAWMVTYPILAALSLSAL